MLNDQIRVSIGVAERQRDRIAAGLIVHHTWVGHRAACRASSGKAPGIRGHISSLHTGLELNTASGANRFSVCHKECGRNTIVVVRRDPGGIEVGTAGNITAPGGQAEHSLHFGLLALSKGVRAICIVHVVLDHVWQIRGFIATAVGAGVTAVVGTQCKRRIANIISVGVGAGLVRGPGEWMVQVEVMTDFMGQCAATGCIWKASGRGCSNGTDLIVPEDDSIIGGRLTAHTGAAVGKTCWTIGIAQNGARGRVWGFHFPNHPDVQVFVVVPGRAALPIAVSLDRIAAVPWVCAQGGLLPDDPAVAVSIRVFVGQPELDLRISGHSLEHRPGLGGIGIQPSVILVQDTKAI